MKFSTKRVLLFVGIVVGVGTAFIPTYYFYNRYQQSQRLLQNPSEAAQEELRMVIAQVSALVVVPAQEQPTLATVSDKEKLHDQPFFSGAENGDRVLIYPKAKKAILYRPSIQRVVEMAPLGSGDTAGAATDAGALQRFRVAIYNGTAKTGLAGSLHTVLVQKWHNLDVVQKENAAKNTYADSVVVAVRADAAQMAADIAAFMDAPLAPLPAGESSPDADILVIIGASRL